VRVGLVTPYDLSVEGGVNRHVQSLARELSRLGHECVIVGPASGEVPAGCHGVRGVVPVPANGSVARIGLLASARASSDLLTRHGVELVHVHEPLVPGPGRHALAWARRRGRPVVATFHANAERELPLQTLLRRLVGSAVGRLDYGIAVSRQAKRFSRAVWRGRTAVVPNGVDLSRFTETLGRLPAVHHPHPTLQVLFVGRFGEPRKGFEVLLDAARRLRRTGRDAAFTVVGSGPEARWRARAARLGVRLVGRLGDEALAAAYREADVFCAPSLGGESFGMVLVEAMAAGCPVVASDIPGYAEAARGAAVLVPRKDGAALAEALWRVGTEAGLRQRLVARGLARAQTLCWTRVAAHVDRIYAFAAGARRPARRRGSGRRRS
jgi:phosphatidylinositol alpha-mannosyltransferase